MHAAFGRVASLVVLFSLACTGTASRAATPAEVGTSYSRVQSARALVDLLLRREFPGAVTYLRAHASPGSQAATMADDEVNSFRLLMRSGAFALVRIAPEDDGRVVAQLAADDGRLMAVLVDFEPGESGRIRRLVPDNGALPMPAPVPLAHPARARAAELVQTLNAADAEVKRGFAASAWRLSNAETPDSIVADLIRLTERIGSPVTLVDVVDADGDDVAVEVRNARGRTSTITLAVEPAAPHRISIAGLELNPERYATHDELVPKRVELPTPTVAVPLTFENGRPIVNVMIEGKGPFRMQVESGCWCIDLTPQNVLALRDRLEPVTQDRVHRVGQEFVDHLHRIRDLRIGDARFSDVIVETNANPWGTDGYIGLPLFRDLLLTIDYPNARLVLERGDLPVDGRTMPLRNIVAELVGMDLIVDGKRIPTILDTQAGGGALAVTPAIAESFSFERPPARVGNVAMVQRGERTAVPVKMGRLTGSFVVGEVTFPRQHVNIFPYPPHMPRLGNLGALILSRFAVTLDQRNGRVRFAGAGPTVAQPPGPYRSFGMEVMRGRNGLLRVSKVEAEGAAAKAGVREGDVVARLGSSPATSVTDPRGELTRAAQSGEPLALEVTRGAETLRFVVQSDVLVA